ncbi:MAG: insulinase family protein [Paludibacteraceae bacterium]|nr:insulinase family protein [Paludibacteraceae bacterium]
MNETFYKILPNGVQIVYRQRPSEVVYLGIMVGAGTRDELEEESGLAHYIEHCVFKGCKPFPNLLSNQGKELTARDIIDQIEGVGGEINAYTTKEETTFYAATPKRYWKRALKLIASMILHPTFPKEETEKEVEVILDEIESYEDSPSELIYDDFESLVFKGHPLARPILGTRKSVRALAKSKSIAQEFMARNYTSDQMVVFAQGDVSLSQLETLTNQLFKDIKAGGTSHAPYDAAPKEHEVRYKKHTHQVHVMLGGLAYPIGHKKQLALYLLNNILGGGSMSSKLNLLLREKKGLVYTIESQYTPLSDTGYWSIYFASDKKDKDECIRLILGQLEAFRKHPISQHQLQKSLQQLHGQMAISSENQENNALAMAKLMLYHGCAPTWEETFRKIAQLTPDDLFDVAQEIFHPSNIYTLIYE